MTERPDNVIEFPRQWRDHVPKAGPDRWVSGTPYVMSASRRRELLSRLNSPEVQRLAGIAISRRRLHTDAPSACRRQELLRHLNSPGAQRLASILARRDAVARLDDPESPDSAA